MPPPPQGPAKAVPAAGREKERSHLHKQIHNGRRQRATADHRIHADAGRNMPGPAHDQRHVQNLRVQGRAMPQDVVVAKHLAMVGSHDHQRVVQQAAVLQAAEEPAQAVVRMRNATGIAVSPRLEIGFIAKPRPVNVSRMRKMRIALEATSKTLGTL